MRLCYAVAITTVFLANGLVRRFMLDIDGYRLLADNLFNNDPELRIAFLSVLRREVRLHYLIKVRSSAGDMGLWGMIEKKTYFLRLFSADAMCCQEGRSVKIVCFRGILYKT